MKMKNMFAALAACVIAASSLAATAMSASAESIGEAYLCIANGVSEQWAAGDLPSGEAVAIEGNGQYKVAVEVGASESILLLLIQTNINIYEEDENAAKIYDKMALTVNSVVINGTEVAYTGPSDGAVSTADNGTDYRLNILNTWGNNVKDIDGAVNNEGLIEVTFTVSGLSFDKEAAATTAPAAAGDTTTTTTTAAFGGNDTTTTTAAGSAGATNTGDAGVGVALVGLTVAGAAAFVSRRKK